MPTFKQQRTETIKLDIRKLPEELREAQKLHCTRQRVNPTVNYGP